MFCYYPTAFNLLSSCYCPCLKLMGFLFWSGCSTFSVETHLHCVSVHISFVAVTAKKGASFCNSHLGSLNRGGRRVKKSEEPRVNMLLGIWWGVRWVFTTNNELYCLTATETEVPDLLACQLLNCSCYQWNPVIVLRWSLCWEFDVVTSWPASRFLMAWLLLPHHGPVYWVDVARMWLNDRFSFLWYVQIS